MKKSFDEYVKEVEPSLNYLAYKTSSKCAIEQEDAKQELLIAAWKAYQTYEPSSSKFITYAAFRMKKRALTLLNNYNKVQSPLHMDEEIERHLPIVPSVEETFEEEELRRESSERLDEIQSILKSAAEVLKGSYERAYKFFVLYRNEMIDGRMITFTEVCRVLKVNRGWMSRIFKEKIKKLATEQERLRIVQQIKDKRRREMAKKSKTTKKITEKGRRVGKDGMKAKIEWLEKMAVQKGKSRPEAIALLTKKYPEMSLNYARTIVYSQMKEYDFAEAKRKGPEKKKVAKKDTAKKATKSKSSKKAKKSDTKKAAKKTKKAVEPVEEALPEIEDDFDF